MRYFLDTEFHEKPGSIELISIGIAHEDPYNVSFYAENADFDWDQPMEDEWLRENVRPHLTGNTLSLESIGPSVLSYLTGDDKPEFWGYYCDYDWVVFCWLFGRMIDLPKNFPKYCLDIKQLAHSMGNPRLPTQDSTEHNALADALWVRDVYKFLTTDEFLEGPKE